MKLPIWFSTAAAAILLASAAHSACYDVSKKEPSSLIGHLSHRIFAGPPNFEDVQKGDTPEPGVCVEARPSDLHRGR